MKERKERKGRGLEKINYKKETKGSLEKHDSKDLRTSANNNEAKNPGAGEVAPNEETANVIKTSCG